MKESDKSISVSLSFEKTSLPPFTDILVLGKNCPLGMNGVGQCLDLLVPHGFSRFEVEDEHVAAVIVNNNLLQRLKPNKIINILSEKVFPLVGASEIIKVDFAVKISFDNFLKRSTW